MRAIIEVDWGMLGCEDAYSWVNAARLKDWDYLHHRQDVIGRQGRPPWQVPPPYLEGIRTFNDRQAELFDRIRQQDDRFFEWLYDDHGGVDGEAAEREYMSAWLAYTDSAWRLFCQMRENYREERRRTRSKKNSGIRTPTVPDKLVYELKSSD